MGISFIVKLTLFLNLLRMIHGVLPGGMITAIVRANAELGNTNF
jgi:hypothetical protein